MSKMYHEDALGYSCILSTNRKDRPFISEDTEQCPFCPGHETLLENIWIELKEENIFDVRIVNNKYAVCDKTSALYGIHDVVIDTPRHDENPKDFSLKQWQKILEAIWQRWKSLEQEENIHFIQVFKNYGIGAGASIFHSHWQIVALQELPLTVISQYEAFNESYKKFKQCPLCLKVKQIQETQVVLENDEWVVFVPQAMQLSYEIWFVPKRHIAHYGKTTKASRDALGEIIGPLLRSMDQVLGHMAYNICIMGGKIEQEVDYHFFIKLLPRAGNLAGFELATGCFISTVDPLVYAQKLKEALVEVRRDKND